MANFRGYLKGRGHVVTRLGHDSLTVCAESWETTIRISVQRTSDGTNHWEVWKAGMGQPRQELLSFDEYIQ